MSNPFEIEFSSRFEVGSIVHHVSKPHQRGGRVREVIRNGYFDMYLVRFPYNAFNILMWEHECIGDEEDG